MTPTMNIEDAFDLPKPVSSLRLSFSRVSSFDTEGPITLQRRKVLKGEYLDFGSVVDSIISKENLDDLYIVFEGKKPTASTAILTDYILENDVNYYDTEEVLLAINKLKLWAKSSDTIKLKKLTKEVRDYLDVETESKGLNKTIISSQLLVEAQEAANTLKTHNHTRDLFYEPADKSVEIVYQQEVNFEYNGFRFLSYLDMIRIDHVNMTVEPYDLKTGSKSHDEWTKSFVTFRYYFQYYLYTVAMPTVLKALGLEDYTVAPFKFIFLGRYEGLPVVFNVGEKWFNAAKKGFVTKSGYKYRGIDELLTLIDWHWENKIFTGSKNIIESNGQLIIQDDFFTENE